MTRLCRANAGHSRGPLRAASLRWVLKGGVPEGVVFDSGRRGGLQGNGERRCVKAPQRKDGMGPLRGGKKGCVAGVPGRREDGLAEAGNLSGPQRASERCGFIQRAERA